jgi:hypothetical protein
MNIKKILLQCVASKKTVFLKFEGYNMIHVYVCAVFRGFVRGTVTYLFDLISALISSTTK